MSRLVCHAVGVTGWMESLSQVSMTVGRVGTMTIRLVVVEQDLGCQAADGRVGRLNPKD